MKIFASLFAGVLLLTSCGQSAPVKYTDGKVVNCNSVKHVDGNAIELLCLGDGSVIDLKSLRGPMMLNIWGSWCGPCKAEIPYLRAFYDKYQDQVQLVGLDVEEPYKEAARPFIESNGFIWPSLFDPDGRTRAEIGMGVPVTWFIDAEGKVIYKKIGAFANYKEVVALAKEHFNLQ
jgi:thiol-disulfide isomerase/thioredoxin